jgi:hypothetical protein
MFINKMQNSTITAIRLFSFIRDRGLTCVFDLDEVLLDAKHRQTIYTQYDAINGVCNADQVGQLDLTKYIAATTADQVALDKNLPLIKLAHMLNHTRTRYHVATARVACEHTRKLLINRSILPCEVISRRDRGDYRKDHILKCEGITQAFGSGRHLKRLILLDDNLLNCEAVRSMGCNSIQITI